MRRVVACLVGIALGSCAHGPGGLARIHIEVPSCPIVVEGQYGPNVYALDEALEPIERDGEREEVALEMCPIPEPPPEPACGDPVNGVWRSLVHSRAWHTFTEMTLRLHRTDDAIDGDVSWRRWTDGEQSRGSRDYLTRRLEWGARTTRSREIRGTVHAAHVSMDVLGTDVHFSGTLLAEEEHLLITDHEVEEGRRLYRRSACWSPAENRE